MKPIKLFDKLTFDSTVEESNSKTRVKSKAPYVGILYERTKDDFGNDILKEVGRNTVVVGGAISSLEHLCGVDASWKPDTLNEIYGINNSGVWDSTKDRIALFGVGTGGSGLQFGSIVEKDIKRRDVPNLIPLRCASELTGEDANLYKFKKDNGDGTYSWYLKEFAVEPTIKTCWKDALDDDSDGTEVTSEIAESTRTEGLQTFAEFILDFNTKDVREYYEYIGSLDTALYNSIGLYIGQKVTLEDGTTEYANVRLFSYLNIDNKSVKIKTVSEYVYRILAIV